MHATPADVTVRRFEGDRAELLPSFRLADDAEDRIAEYLPRGEVWVAHDAAGSLLGHAHAEPHGVGCWEITNIAVAEHARGTGTGRALLAAVEADARAAGIVRIELATATVDVGNLRFYQRCGYRMVRVVRDAFVPATGYPDDIWVDGLLLRDQIWFDKDL